MAGEVGEYAAFRRVLSKARRGEGQHVLVLPGLMAGDYTTLLLRNYLASLGYHPHGWGVGRNIGPTRQIVDSMRESVENLTAEHGPISIIGWSLGGLYARQLGRAYPDQVRQVITLASPFRLIHRGDTLATLVFDRYRHLHVSAEELDLPEQEHLRDPMPVPTTAIYSRSDGIVPWQACLNELMAPRRTSRSRPRISGWDTTRPRSGRSPTGSRCRSVRRIGGRSRCRTACAAGIPRR